MARPNRRFVIRESGYIIGEGATKEEAWDAAIRAWKTVNRVAWVRERCYAAMQAQGYKVVNVGEKATPLPARSRTIVRAIAKALEGGGHDDMDAYATSLAGVPQSYYKMAVALRAACLLRLIAKDK